MSSSTYLADGNIKQGDVVCLVTSTNLQPRVRTASMPLPVSAPIVGVALTNDSNGSVTVADCGGVDASVTGLPSGMRQPIAVLDSGRCTRTLAGAVWLIGDANESGNLEIQPRIFDNLDVRLFGAAGDGVTDDSAPIQAAIAAYRSSSGRIVFTSGVFRITNAFSPPSIPVNIAIEFGPGGQLKVDDGVHVAFDGPVVANPLQQIFQNATISGHGTVDLRGNREVYVEWWGARGLNQPGDDAPAFQAAINASRHHLGWSQIHRWGGTAVRFYNGPYHWASPVHLSGSVTLEGEKPGEFSPSLIVIAPDIGDTKSSTHGGALVVDGWAYDGDALNLGVVPRAAWARIRNMSMKQVNPPNSLVITCGVKVYANRVQIENFYASGFGDGITITSTKDYRPISEYTYAHSCELSGTIDLGSCSRYGLWIHGGEASVANIVGSISVHDCGSWGLVLDSFLGDGALGAFHTASNGIIQYSNTHTGGRISWAHGESAYGHFIWAAGRTAVLGELVLPPPAHANGWQYRVTTVSPSNPTFANPEPLWSTAAEEGATLTDANGNVFTAWMEEGGSVVRHYGAAVNGMVVIGFLYQEKDQQSARLPNCVILGQTKETVIDPRYAPQWGFSGNSLMPFVYKTSWLVPWGPPTNPYEVRHPIQVELGGNHASPFTVRTFDASQLQPDREGTALQGGNYHWKHENPNWFISEQWDPLLMRWVIRSGVHDAYTGYTICGSRSLPYPGAICFPHLFIGGNIRGGPTGYEVRQSAVCPLEPSSSLPDIGGTGGTANRGAWTPGDWIWNTTRNPNQQPLHPVAWRPVKKTGFPTGGWSPGVNLPAGSIVRPGTPGDSVFRKQDGEKTGATQPIWGDNPGTYADGNSKWDWWGTFNDPDDPTAWEPVITESPTMLVKNVKDVDMPWTITLTEDEAAHQRITFTGQLMANTTVTVPAGPARGWVRLFFNDSSGAFSLTVLSSPGDQGVAVPQGKSQLLWHDGTHVRAAAPPV